MSPFTSKSALARHVPSRRVRRMALALVALSAALAGAPVPGQAQLRPQGELTAARATPARGDSIRIVDAVAVAGNRRLLTPANLWTLAAFGVATVVVAPYDQAIAQEFEEPERGRSAPVARAASVFRALGGPGALALSAGTYAVGRLAHRPGLADAGLHTTEAIAAGAAASAIVKAIVGRARPYAVGGADADEFRFGRGWGSNTAFPSGHTTVAFAAAAAAQAELARSAFGQTHATLVRLATPVLYGSAALVGVSRLYHDKHWASDVVAGAAIGIVTGRALVRRQHAGPPGALERWLVPSVSPTRNGGAIGWSVTFR